MAITSTGNTKVNGSIGTGNAIDGVSINGNNSNINLNSGGGIARAGTDGVGTNFGDNAQNNLPELVIANGTTVVTINGDIKLIEGSKIVIAPHSTLNIGGFSFTAGDEAITYIHSSISTYQSCRIDNLFGDHNDDDYDPSGVGMTVMGNEALPLVDAACC
ncbi:MAG: hypothetical protein AAF673_01895 [Pseudomonadota bacterium]